MGKNWIGNKKSTYVTLGASNHAEHERQTSDYYATHPSVIKPLFNVENFNLKIWECACGEGHLSKAMDEEGKEVYSSDIVQRGFTKDIFDFLKCTKKDNAWNGDIITNPPYKYAQEFVEKSLELINEGNKVAMFLKLQFLEGQKRYEFFKIFPPKKVYVFANRQQCAMNGNFEKYGANAVAYAWFVWEKGFEGKPEIEWINTTRDRKL